MPCQHCTLGAVLRNLPPLSLSDYAGIALIIAACLWVLVELWLSRGLNDGGPGRGMLRSGSAAVVATVAVLYVGRLVQVTPWIGRTLLLTALALMAVGSRLDRHDANR